VSEFESAKDPFGPFPESTRERESATRADFDRFSDISGNLEMWMTQSDANCSPRQLGNRLTLEWRVTAWRLTAS